MQETQHQQPEGGSSEAASHFMQGVIPKVTVQYANQPVVPSRDNAEGVTSADADAKQVVKSNSESASGSTEMLPPPLPKPKETRIPSGARTNTIPDPAVSLSASRPTMLPPPCLSIATSVPINSTPTLTSGSTWGPVAASAAARAEAAEPGRIGDLKRFTLWETKTRFYLVAYNTSQTRFRILKVDRTPPILASGGASANKDANEPRDHQVSTAESASASRMAGAGQRDRDSRLDPKRGARDLASAEHGTKVKGVDPSNVSASGQRYLSVDDAEIPQLNKRLLDMKQAETAGKDGQTTSFAASGSKFSQQDASNSNAGSSSILLGGHQNNHGPTASGSVTLSPTIPQGNAANSKSTGAGKMPSEADWELNVTSDRVVYSRSQVAELLKMIREGNRSSGGLKEIGRFFGIVGFIRFTGTYYMVLINRRSVVALIGGHYIYHCDETVILPVCHPSILAALPNRTKALEQEEARLLHLFRQVDLSKNFYFSYTYDLTKTLQDNLTSSPEEFAGQDCSTSTMRPPITAWGYNEKFVWNHHLLRPAFGASELEPPDADPRNEWVLPLVYGFVDQAKLSVLNRTVYVTLIARRSRHFAGARFLKRGANEKGQVANDVETEQIVSEALNTPFFAPGRSKRFDSKRRQSSQMTQHQDGDAAGGYMAAGSHGTTGPSDANGEREDDSDWEESDMHYDASPRYTSYVMMRGSIPIYWTQDSTGMSARPPIEISLVDPYYSAAALHFDDLFHRYGTPVIVLNLIKSKEKQEREVKLLRAFGECVTYLNQFLPDNKKIKYIAWDMSRSSKSHDQDVIGILEDIAEETVETTRFFHSGPEPSSFRYSTGLRAKYGIPIAQEKAIASLATSEKEKQDIRRDGNKGASLGNPARRETILLQDGVARVNCVDCLDRTNAAQFVIGKAAFGHQLHALGLLDDPSLPFDSDAVNMLTEMYHDLGDTIAMQYGGSALAHTTDTYRKINQWTSHSRDVLESMKRYYANSFADADKQAAINLFLGVNPDLPDFSPHMFPVKVPRSTTTDSDRRTSLPQSEFLSRVNGSANANSTAEEGDMVSIVPFRPNYQKWYDPSHLEPRKSIQTRMRRLKEVVNADVGFWAEYYRPSLFTDLMRHHAFKMTAVHQYSQSVGLPPHGLAHVGSVTSSGSHRGVSFGGGHARSQSNSSISTSMVAPERLVEYASPFKPRGAVQAHSSAVSEGTSAHRQHNRRQSIDSVGSQSGAPGSPSSSSITMVTPSKALIGGVRRWMSINRPIGPHGERKRSKRYGSGSSIGGDTMIDSEGRSKLQASGTASQQGAEDTLPVTVGGFDPNAFNFAGPWQAMGIGVAAGGGTAGGVTGQAQGANKSLDAVLNKLCNPSVSIEEETEYTFYTTQFLASGDASDTHRDESHHFIDEKDVRIYEEGVTLKDGNRTGVERLLQAGNVDAALVAYAASTETAALMSTTTNEAKVRAYSSWLSLGQTKVAGF